MSPGYPDAYPDNVNCVWTIQDEDPKSTIELAVHDFRLEQSANCKADSVTIINSNGSSTGV